MCPNDRRRAELEVDSDFPAKRDDICLFWRTFRFRRCRQKKKCVEDASHTAQLAFDRRCVSGDLFVPTRFGNLGDAHSQQLEIEHGDIEGSLQIVRSVGTAQKIRAREFLEPWLHDVVRSPLSVLRCPLSDSMSISGSGNGERATENRSHSPMDVDHGDRFFQATLDDRELRIMRRQVRKLTFEPSSL